MVLILCYCLLQLLRIFLSENLKFFVVFWKWQAYFGTEMQNHCMDGGALICDCSAVTISSILRTSSCTRPKHHPQHP